MGPREQRATAAAEARRLLAAGGAAVDGAVGEMHAAIKGLDHALLAVLESGDEVAMGAMADVGRELGGLLTALTALSRLTRDWAASTVFGVTNGGHSG
jgi:hypothetical protein